MTSADDEAHSSVPKDNDEEEEEEEENNPPPEEKKKRGASTNLEAGTPKKGKGALAVDTVWDVDSSPERRPRTRPQAASSVTWLTYMHIQPFLFINLTWLIHTIAVWPMTLSSTPHLEVRWLRRRC